MKFFVAKVDASKVEFETKPDGSKRAMLSPLRFHYDSRRVLAAGPARADQRPAARRICWSTCSRPTRYEVGQLPQRHDPDQPRGQGRDPRAVREVLCLAVRPHPRSSQPQGASVDRVRVGGEQLRPLPRARARASRSWSCSAPTCSRATPMASTSKASCSRHESPGRSTSDFVLTRLHARYDKASLGEDLVFQTAGGLRGRSRHARAAASSTRASARPAGRGTASRAATRSCITGSRPIRCMRPLWDSWGGPPRDLPAGPAPASPRSRAARVRAPRRPARQLRDPLGPRRP